MNKTTNKLSFLKASETPVKDLEVLAYPGQPQSLRLYRSGYEQFMNAMPRLYPDDYFLEQKLAYNRSIMKKLANELRRENWLHDETLRPEDKTLVRTTLALEHPLMASNIAFDTGCEIVIGQWGDGMETPIHGHAAGFIHEEVLFGRMFIETYEIVDEKAKIVRRISSKAIMNGVSASLYERPGSEERKTLIHKVRSYGYTATLHFFSKHPADGQGNTFKEKKFIQEGSLNQSIN